MSNLCFSSIMSPDSRRSMTWLNHSTLTCGVLKGLAMDKSCLLFGSCGRQINRVRIGILKLLWHFSEKICSYNAPSQDSTYGSGLTPEDWQRVQLDFRRLWGVGQFDNRVAWFWILSSLRFGKLHGVTSPCFQGLNKSILGVLGDPSG